MTTSLLEKRDLYGKSKDFQKKNRTLAKNRRVRSLNSPLSRSSQFYAVEGRVTPHGSLIHSDPFIVTKQDLERLGYR